MCEKVKSRKISQLFIDDSFNTSLIMKFRNKNITLLKK